MATFHGNFRQLKVWIKSYVHVELYYHTSIETVTSSMDSPKVVCCQERSLGFILLLTCIITWNTKIMNRTCIYSWFWRFVPTKFEEIFSKYAHTNKTALTSDELRRMLKSNRNPEDYRGWLVFHSSFNYW